MSRILIPLLLATLAASAGAQDVYKYIDGNGRVVYTDNPKAGGGTARRVEDQTSVIHAPAPKAATRAFIEKADARGAALDRAVDDIAAASNELRAAEERRNQGIEPVEGERQGRRYRPEYWQRQEALQRDVDTARNRLDAANERRNALR